MKLTIEPYEIVVLVNMAWQQSFARSISNKKAIEMHGWNPLNRNLLLNETLRSTMTEEERVGEGVTSCVVVPSHHSAPHPLSPQSHKSSTASIISTLTSSTASTPSSVTPYATSIFISTSTPPRLLHPLRRVQSLIMVRGWGQFASTR